MTSQVTESWENNGYLSKLCDYSGHQYTNKTSAINLVVVSSQ